MPLPSPAPRLKLSVPAWAGAFIVICFGWLSDGFGASDGLGATVGLSTGVLTSSWIFSGGGFTFGGGGGGGGSGMTVVTCGADTRFTPAVSLAKCHTSAATPSSTATVTTGLSQRRGSLCVVCVFFLVLCRFVRL